MKLFSTPCAVLMLKKILVFLPLILGLGIAGQIIAQTTCTYTIEMFDSFGDGWNGNSLTVTSAGNTTMHTLNTGSFGTSSFQVTEGEPVILVWTTGSFPTEPSFNLLNPDGILIFAAASPVPAGEIYNEPGFCPDCPSPDPDIIVVNQVTDTSARVNWLDVNTADFYIIEYGPEGFPLGEGLVREVTTSEVTLTGLNPCVHYDVYLTVNCGLDSLGSTLGAIQFMTDYIPSAPGDTCTYTIELFDSFGDGWNGADLTVLHDGNSYNFTIASGSSAIFEIDVISNLPIELVYSPGIFENEVSYNIVDPNGLIIFSDGPFPATGDVFTTIACPTCPAPLDAYMSDVNANNAILSWTTFPGSTGNYIIEYGTMGFTRGTGTTLTVPVTQNKATLTGLMEKTWYNVYILLECDTEFSKPIGPLMFQTIWLNDVGVSSITEPDPNEVCDFSTDQTISVNLSNYGQLPQTLFEFYYAVNGVQAGIPIPQDGFFTGVVGNDSTQNISFETTWDFSSPGVYVIEAWTVLEGDSNPANDTAETTIITAYPKPVQEDFEDNAVPMTWSFQGNAANIYSPNAHGNPTYVFGTQLFSFSTPSTLNTGRVGYIEPGDSLHFDYRFVGAFSPATAPTLQPGDSLAVQISTDCGENYETIYKIDTSNHVPSTSLATVTVSLEEYAGEIVTIQFVGKSSNLSYWLDIDNINIPGCSGNLGLVADVVGSIPNGNSGSILVTPYFGVAPYTYSWNTGDTDSLATGLASGVYEVVVTDATGCTDVMTYDVGIFTDTRELALSPDITLYPNPTSGRATLDVVFQAATDYQVRVLNLNGQFVYTAEKSAVTETREEMDFSQQPPGLYIMQIIANDQAYYAKLMITR